MLRRGEDSLGNAFLDKLAALEDIDVVANGGNDRQIMRDEKKRQPTLFSEIAEKAQDARLNGDVKGGDRFVANEERRFQCERPRNADALALPAAELVRESRFDFGGKADLLEKSVNIHFELVHASHLGDGIADALPRIQRADGILEDHLDSSRTASRPGGMFDGWTVGRLDR